MRKIKSKISERIETGALQINDEWPGLFVRGDDCFVLLEALERIIPQTSFGSGISNLYSIREGLIEIVTNTRRDHNS